MRVVRCLVLVMLIGTAHATARVELPLPAASLLQPEVIVLWLQANARAADTQGAERARQQAEAAMRQGDRQGTLQSLEHSARLDPSPTALVALAEARLSELGKRFPEGAAIDRDALHQIGQLYQSALASERAYPRLARAAHDTLYQQTQCLHAYLAKRTVPTPCRPLQLLGLTTAEMQTQ
ncbi:hypothetical protein HNQ59_000057 [Chitinivorax tropicus]|uniref:Uncharacterized protein n=1 Tax=Chitinivorax tropicus TaxID=714531 RepID=A0A840MGZ0_9PROT|nr:hypothetical protein [Chitinivorax tropicus]MBB5016795.1 hypothetical protein [Chitinivorax tropicus]